jgi:hypothetical protein
MQKLNLNIILSAKDSLFIHHLFLLFKLCKMAPKFHITRVKIARAYTIWTYIDTEKCTQLDSLVFYPCGIHK